MIRYDVCVKTPSRWIAPIKDLEFSAAQAAAKVLSKDGIKSVIAQVGGPTSTEARKGSTK